MADEPPSAAKLMDDLMWGREPVGGPFTLVDHTGRTRSDTEFRGKFVIIYFGYTFCSDICPIDLMAITRALELLGPAADAVQPIFITVDPERDSTDKLADYVMAFAPGMIALTGTPEEIRKVATAYKAYFAKAEYPGGKGYSVDHTAFIYLVEKDGQFAGFLPPATTPERIAEVIRQKLP